MKKDKATYYFSVEAPCSESWEEMTQAEKGKFCGSCQHEVIDFSRMSDAEIIRYMSQAQGSVCARFNNKQLNRPMQLTHSLQRPVSLRAILAGMAFLTVMTPAVMEARSVKPSVETEILQNPTKPEPLPLSDSIYVYKGKVLHGFNRTPVAGAEVTLDADSLRVMTDSTGYFELTIPASMARTHFTIRVTSYDFDDNAVVVDGAIQKYDQVNSIYLLPTERHTMGKVAYPPPHDTPKKPKKNK